MSQEKKSRKALLVIDMQKGSFTPETPRFDTPGVVKRINDLANIFRERNQPVIFIQHDGTKGAAFIPNTSEWELLDELEVDPADLIVSKTANDAFYETELESVLKKMEISQLVFTGCATDFCVESTLQSALTRDYLVTVVKDGHTTGERPHLPAEKVIEHYNWVWQHMIPTSGRVEVKELEEVKREWSGVVNR